MIDTSKILIVDRSPLYREGVKHVLSTDTLKLMFYEANSISDLLIQVKEQVPLDLIIIDAELLQVEKKSILKEFLSRTETPVLLLCGNITANTVRIARRLGAQAVASKTDSLCNLRRMINNALAGIECWPQLACAKSSIIPKNSETKTIQEGIHYLTHRQKEVLNCLIDGMMNKQIAHHLGVEENTVKAHVSNILRKLQINNRTQLVAGLQNHYWSDQQLNSGALVHG